jgi:hypothetical protein
MVKLRIAPGWAPRAGTRGRSCDTDNDMREDIMMNVHKLLEASRDIQRKKSCWTSPMLNLYAGKPICRSRVGFIVWTHACSSGLLA